MSDQNRAKPDPTILSPDTDADPKLSSFSDIATFLDDVAARFLRGELSQGDVKTCVLLSSEARGLAEDRSKYQAALELLLNQAKTLPQRKSGDAPLHGSPPFMSLVPTGPVLN